MDGKTEGIFTVREFSESDCELINEFFDSMGGETRALFNRRDYNRRGALKYCTTGPKQCLLSTGLSEGSECGSRTACSVSLAVLLGASGSGRKRAEVTWCDRRLWTRGLIRLRL